MKKIGIIGFISLVLLFFPLFGVSAQTVFRFASLSDSQDGPADLTKVLNQINTLNPNIVIVNGDFENDAGPSATMLDPKVNALKSAGLFERTFVVRGNHDADNAASVWQSLFTGYFGSATRTLPAGVTNYVPFDSSTTYLTYSFDYGNSRFIGIDVPGCPSVMTSAQYTFMDNRLSNAESMGLTHAFLYWHGPAIKVETTHPCSYPSALITLINKHPIVSATFHGHSHILGWTHVDSTRVPGLTHAYEQFMTSPAGGYLSYYANRIAANLDYVYPLGTAANDMAFGAVSVSGNSFTVNLYKVGTTSPVWSKTFSKSTSGPAMTSTPTPTSPASTSTPTKTPTVTPTKTPTPTPGGSTGSKQTKYYLVDRVRSNSDYATLAGWGINTAVVQFDINSGSSTWQSMLQSAKNSNIKIVIWPADYSNKRSNCDSGSPFPVSTNGDINKVKALLDVATQYSNFIGIVNAHEWMWTSCPMALSEMAGLKTQLKAYLATKGRSDVKIWNYTDSLEKGYASSALPDNQISNIMDVAVIWKHCAGNAEGTCDSSQARIVNSRARLASLGLENQVELVYLIQSFTASSPYNGKFTLSQLETYGCQFIHTSALNGFGYYTWDAGWWQDLHSWTDLQPAVSYIHSNCINTSGSTPTPIPLPGDLDSNGHIDIYDYNILVRDFGKTGTSGWIPADIDKNGKVDIFDYNILVGNFGK